MATRKVLLLESGLLPGAGVHSLLSELKDVEVVAARFNNIEDLIQIIDAFWPQVLILDDPCLVESTLTLLPLLQRKSIPRAIIVHWQENMIEVYDRHRVAIRELADFLAML